MSKSKLLFLLVGAVGGFGVSELRHSPAEPAPTPTRVVVGAKADESQSPDRNRKERERWCREYLGRLEHEKMSDKEKMRYVLALGTLRSPEAIPYLVKNIDFEPQEANVWIPPPIDRCEYPCFDALQCFGVEAVPYLVDAFMAGRLDNWQIHYLYAWLRDDYQRARVAYLYAQGYYFANKDNPVGREVAFWLVRNLGDRVSSAELPYPPPWINDPPAWLKPDHQ